MLALIVLATAGCGEREAERPDIVLIVVDTLRADHLGLYGHERPTSPRIDALGAEGAWYTRAYAHSGWTLPSMASLLTGLLPHEHRAVRDPEQSHHFGRLADETETVAERIAARGYACGAVVNNSYLAPMFGLDQGFGESWDHVGATNAAHRSAAATVDAALRWLDAQTNPVFLMVHFMEPHLLYDPPAAVRGTFTGDGPAPVAVPWGHPDTVDRIRAGNRPSPEELDYIRKLYDEEILYVDGAVGRLVDALRARPRWNETVVVVTSDHGEEFLERGGFEHGHSLFAEVTRVPLIVRGTGLAGGPQQDVVQHIDLADGLLAVAGARRDRSGPDLFSTLRAGERWSSGGVVQGSVLFGPQRVAYGLGDLRMHLRLDDRSGEVWRIDDQGVERESLRSPELREASRRLAARLRTARGDLEPTRPPPGPKLDDPEIVRQLISLGYIDAE